MTRMRVGYVCALLTVCLTLAGCATVQIKSFRYLGAPDVPPTDPSQVQILESRPVRPFTRLGRITAVPEGDVDNEKIEAALRKEAAKMGADAVVVGYQGRLPRGFQLEGLPGDMEARREMGRVVIGTAIKFGEE